MIEIDPRLKGFIKSHSPEFPLGETTMMNGRRYKVTDTGKPYVNGEYPSGGLVIHMWLNEIDGWGFNSNSPSKELATRFFEAVARLKPLDKTESVATLSINRIQNSHGEDRVAVQIKQASCVIAVEMTLEDYAKAGFSIAETPCRITRLSGWAKP